MANRLKLDFGISDIQDRKNFVDSYIAQPQFVYNPLTDDELETIANYILWGKDEDGLNCTQRKEIQIETRNKTWQRNDTESLDALIESPTFNEASFRPTTSIRPRIAREVFDRSKTLEECPPHLVPVFKELFKQIDIVELGINFYEFSHGRREEPPRASLLKKFTEAEILQIQESAAKWNQYKYLKKRHLIVELRREQFTLRDTYVTRITRKTPPEPETELLSLDFDAEIPVYPLGIPKGPLGALLFRPEDQLIPTKYSEQDLEKIVAHYWSKKSTPRPLIHFDFENLEHVYELFDQLDDLQESASEVSVDSNLGQLIQTLRYYISLTDLTDAQKEILELKICKFKNQEIANMVNEKFGKTYTANYISTIFRQKIIPRINDSVTYHTKIIENLCFTENFKKCSGCGRTLLMDSENFVRKTRSKDGFATKCKKCDKADRLKKKEQIK